MISITWSAWLVERADNPAWWTVLFALAAFLVALHATRLTKLQADKLAHQIDSDRQSAQRDVTFQMLKRWNELDESRWRAWKWLEGRKRPVQVERVRRRRRYRSLYNVMNFMSDLLHLHEHELIDPTLTRELFGPTMRSWFVRIETKLLISGDVAEWLDLDIPALRQIIEGD